MATDAFGRLRTSEPFTTFNYHPSPAFYDTSDNDVWVRDVSNNGDIQYDGSNNLIKLITGTSNNSYAIRTTKVPMDYQPGKSRLIMMSGCMIDPVPAAGTKVFSRMGLMNVASPTITDGVWFEVDCSNSKMYWSESVQNGAGSYNVIRVPDSSWNIDTFDGSGPSGKTLLFSDMSHNLLIVIDQEWLGVGRLRCGFNIDGVTYYAHAFTHGTMSQAYTASPRQRLGYEILTEASLGTQYTMSQICSACISEGGFFPLGTRNSIITSTQITPTTNTLLLAIKIKTDSKYSNGIIKPINIDIMNSNSNSTGTYEVRLLSTNGTIGTQLNDASFSNLNNSIVRYFAPTVATNTIAGGYTINSGFISSRATISLQSSDYETLLTRSICTKYDTIAIISTAVVGSPTILAAIDFIESL